jgi:hypothetical protein
LPDGKKDNDITLPIQWLMIHRPERKCKNALWRVTPLAARGMVCGKSSDKSQPAVRTALWLTCL